MVMKMVILEKTRQGFLFKYDDSKCLYMGYTKRQALKKFRQDNNLVHKKLEIIEI